MSFEIVTSNDAYLHVRITEVDLSIVNAIRRIILSEIPNTAFAFDPYDQEKSGITIYSNTSSLHNEFLAHRISLIPLCFEENIIENFKPKKYRFVLKKHNTTTDIIPITTNDFEIYDENNEKYPESVKKMIFPMNPITKDHILITKLKPNLYNVAKGEDIDIECYASVNIAKEHARWSPVSKCTFHNSLDEKLVETMRKSVSPNDINKFETLDKYRYFIKNKYDEASSFEFEIETECRMKPVYLLRKSIILLKEKVEKFVIDLPTMDIEFSDITNNMCILRVKDTHTLLNVLQSMIFNQTFRNIPPSSNPLNFIGYNQPHPLDSIMILKLVFKDYTSKEGLIEFLKEQCRNIVSYLDTLHASII